LGRFLSVDPVGANTGNGLNFNRYWYANDNPYVFTDPDGRYGRGTGWDKGTWATFNHAQQNAASRAEQAATKLDQAIASGKDVAATSAGKAFESTFGKGTATVANMTTMSANYKAMAAVLNNRDTNKGAANATTDMKKVPGADASDRSTTPEATPHGTQDVWVNTSHGDFANPAALTSDTEHESTHGALGFSDTVTQNGTQISAYKDGNPAQMQAFMDLPTSSPAQAMTNPDTVVAGSITLTQ
jgi:hypothetical protein